MKTSHIALMPIAAVLLSAIASPAGASPAPKVFKSSGIAEDEAVDRQLGALHPVRLLSGRSIDAGTPLRPLYKEEPPSAQRDFRPPLPVKAPAEPKPLLPIPPSPQDTSGQILLPQQPPPQQQQQQQQQP